MAGKTKFGQRMVLIAVRVTPAARQRLLAEAERRGLSFSDVVRAALERWLREKEVKDG
jgi:Arc/MetJ-type ribon-helix-helix transcriptional regulator